MKRLHILVIISILAVISFIDWQMAAWVRAFCMVGALFGLALLHINDNAYDKTSKGIFKDYQGK